MTVFNLITAVVFVAVQVAGASAEQAAPTWYDNYSEGMSKAKQSGRMMLVYFCADKVTADKDPLCRKLGKDEVLRPLAKNNVLVRIPLSTRARVGGREIRLIDHAAYAELLHQPGIALVDFTKAKSPYFGRVVSIYPLSLPGALSIHNLKSLLTLPLGTLTQRTLILAVRIHPEGPASTDGALLTTLAKESESHSDYQARINLQGHHNWESRFHRISDRLPGGYLAQEVCAESWPGMGLIAAAMDCVASWRQSSGHWSAVRGQHAYYGYDMKRGSNGIWYATGIFSTR
ncbi:MAG: thioredoxin domain-containing protein [Pirellulaceae bacterium]